MTLTSELRATLRATQTGSNDFGGPKFAPLVDKILQLANGNGANQANILWADERTLAPSATEDIDLAGALTDAFGSTITAASLVAILVIAAPGNANNVVVANGTHPFALFSGTTPAFAVKPNGFFFAAAPGAGGLGTVTGGTGDDITITNSSSGTPVTYQIALLARSA